MHQAQEEFSLADSEGLVRKYDIRKLLAPTRTAMTATVADRMRVFGAAGKG
jgi:fructose/tagatose bisphosphate aldolase